MYSLEGENLYSDFETLMSHVCHVWCLTQQTRLTETVNEEP